MMRLGTLAVAGQVTVCVLLLAIGLVTIVVLEEAIDTVSGLDRAPGGGALDPLETRLGGAVALVAIVTGIAIFVSLLLGAWVHKHVSAPVHGLQAAVSAISDGHVQRRVNESGMIGELRVLAIDVNRITDRLRKLERARATDLLLARAVLEDLFDAEGVGGAALDPTGRLVASNARVRTLLEEHDCAPAALLGRDSADPNLGARVDEVRDGGVLRGYVARTA